MFLTKSWNDNNCWTSHSEINEKYIIGCRIIFCYLYFEDIVKDVDTALETYARNQIC